LDGRRADLPHAILALANLVSKSVPTSETGRASLFCVFLMRSLQWWPARILHSQVAAFAERESFPKTQMRFNNYRYYFSGQEK
jgi:hypothetical protein